MNANKSRLLLTTAVLLAGVGLASAQGMHEGGGGMNAGGSAGEHSRASGGMSQGAGGASHSQGPSDREGMRNSGRAAGNADRSERQTIGQSRNDHNNARQSQSAEHEKHGKDQTVGRSRDDHNNARQSQSENEKHGKDRTVGQSHSDRDKARQSSDNSDKNGQKNQTVGQSRNDRTRQSQGAEQNKTTATGSNTRDKAQGKSAQDRNTTTTGANTRSNARGENAQQGQGTTTGANTQGQVNSRNQAQGETTQSMSGRVQVSAQQQTRLQQSVLDSRNVQRVRVNDNSIHFRVDAGVVVPRNISVVSVAAYPVLIDVYPDYRDDNFFVVDDEIVVLDRSRRIVDVIPAGPRTHYAHRGGSSEGRGSVAVLDLSPDEIRVVQEVLIERGLLSGDADGILSPETRAALSTFQRQQGFQATGTIDSRTVSALGVTNKISATQGQSTTVGQGRNGQMMDQDTKGQNAGQTNAPAQQNQTTGQAGQNRPSASGHAQENQPTTPGQAGTQQPSGQTTGQAPAPGANQPRAKRDEKQPGR